MDIFKDLPIATYLLALSSVFTASAYTWLAAPPTWTKNPMPAILSFALGYGFAPRMFFPPEWPLRKDADHPLSSHGCCHCTQDRESKVRVYSTRGS